jgi:hypothetical protein
MKKWISERDRAACFQISVCPFLACFSIDVLFLSFMLKRTRNLKLFWKNELNWALSSPQDDCNYYAGRYSYY